MNQASPRIKSATIVEIILLSLMKLNALAFASKLACLIPSSVEVAFATLVVAEAVAEAAALLATTGLLTVFFAKVTVLTGTSAVTTVLVVLVVEVEPVVRDERLELELEPPPDPDVVVVFSETVTDEQTFPATSPPIESVTVKVADLVPAAEYVLEAIDPVPDKLSVPDQLYEYGAVPPDTFADHVTDSPSLIEVLSAEQVAVKSAGIAVTLAEVQLYVRPANTCPSDEAMPETIASFFPEVVYVIFVVKELPDNPSVPVRDKLYGAIPPFNTTFQVVS